MIARSHTGKKLNGEYTMIKIMLTDNNPNPPGADMDQRSMEGKSFVARSLEAMKGLLACYWIVVSTWYVPVERLRVVS